MSNSAWSIARLMRRKEDERGRHQLTVWSEGHCDRPVTVELSGQRTVEKEVEVENPGPVEHFCSEAYILALGSMRASMAWRRAFISFMVLWKPVFAPPSLLARDRIAAMSTKV